ncbi:MAG TPA: hypothetical protein VF681_02655 [Abditibacteriaceae bacterium]|jgi:5-hydroxyisourate hydrolase-like protein (transthyretin family)
MKLSLAFVSTALLFASIAHAEPARVAGRIFNGTAGPNRPAPNITVELVRPGGLQGQTGAVLKTVRTDAAGRFDFGTMNLDPKEILTTRVKTKGFDYETPAYDAAGRLKQFMPPDAKPIDPKNVEMTIFDSAVKVPLVFTVHHVAIEGQDRQINVVERIVVENKTRTTMVGGPDGATIKLNLPPTAHDVELDQEAAPGGKLIKKDDGWYVAKAITPEQYGSRNAIIVKYHIEYQNGFVDLSRKLEYPVKFFFMAREQKDKELKIDAPQLSKDTVQQIPIDGNMQDRLVNSKGQPMGAPVFTAGTAISMKVSRPTDPMQWGFVGFIAVLCMVVPGVLLLSRRGAKNKIAEPVAGRSVMAAHRTTEEFPAVSREALSPSAHAIIEDIAALDELWDAGDISRNEYQTRRAALKTQLRDATAQA